MGSALSGDESYLFAFAPRKSRTRRGTSKTNERVASRYTYLPGKRDEHIIEYGKLGFLRVVEL